MVVRVEASVFELEKNAGVNEPSAPQDKLLSPVKRFRRPSRSELERSFRVAHILSEACYKGNGYWDDFGHYWRSPLRSTSDRVIGYIRGYKALGEEIYKQRALEGLEYLLNEQKDDGGYTWYYNSHRGVYNRSDGLFDTGIAGRAFVDAYRLFKDERYLVASNRIAAWEMECPVSTNNNYNMFAVWHLAAHYKLTGDEACLESAIHKTREGGFPEQMASGGWPGHNSWVWYHGIIVRGMAELYRVMPTDHPFREELYGPMTAAINRVIREQLPTGEVPPNPGVKKRRHTCPFITEALIMARSVYGAELDPVIYGLMRRRLRSELDEAGAREVVSKRQKHDDACASACAAKKDTVVWKADMQSYHTDPKWGEMADGAFNCWYPIHDPEPGRVVWQRVQEGQKITATGEDFFGGLGFKVPANALEMGRRYMLTVKAKAQESPGAKEVFHLFLASAYSGPERDNWDPFSSCEFTRENAAYDDFVEVSVPFTASGETNYVYFWTMSGKIPSGESLSITVSDVYIKDFGLPMPTWKSPIPDGEPHLALEVDGTYLEEMP